MAIAILKTNRLEPSLPKWGKNLRQRIVKGILFEHNCRPVPRHPDYGFCEFVYRACPKAAARKMKRKVSGLIAYGDALPG
ncbi:hypothetical protein D3C73_1348720 [compost metagenome]